MINNNFLVLYILINLQIKVVLIKDKLIINPSEFKNGQEIKLINYNNFHTSQLDDWWCYANIPYSLSKSWNRYRNHCLSCVLFNQLYDLQNLRDAFILQRYRCGGYNKTYYGIEMGKIFQTNYRVLFDSAQYYLLNSDC